MKKIVFLFSCISFASLMGCSSPGTNTQSTSGQEHNDKQQISGDTSRSTRSDSAGAPGNTHP